MFSVSIREAIIFDSRIWCYSPVLVFYESGMLLIKRADPKKLTWYDIMGKENIRHERRTTGRQHSLLYMCGSEAVALWRATKFDVKTRKLRAHLREYRSE